MEAHKCVPVNLGQGIMQSIKVCLMPIIFAIFYTILYALVKSDINSYIELKVNDTVVAIKNSFFKLFVIFAKIAIFRKLLHTFASFWSIYLARLVNLPEGLYILLASISSFFLSLFFYYEQSYLSVYWTNFHDLFTKWKVFA